MKALQCGVLACVLPLAVAAAQTPGPCAGDDCEALQAQLSSAASHLDQSRNQFVAAVRQLIEAIAATAGDGVAARTAGAEELGRALTRWDQSLRTYRTILLDSAGSSANAHLALAAAYLERGRGPDALAQATMAGRLDPARSESHVLRGLAYDLQKRPADAAAAFAQAAKLAPGNAAATYGLAQRLMAVGDEAGAADALRRFDAAASATRDSATPARTAAAPFVRAGLLRQAPESPVVFAPPAYVKAFSLLADGELDQSVVEFRAVAARDDSSTREVREDADVREGLAAFRRADLESAIAHFNQAVDRWPGRSQPRVLLGLVYRTTERDDEAIAQLSAAAALNASDDFARRTLADLLVSAKRPAQAEQVLEEAIRAEPGAGGAHYQLGRLYQSLGRNGDALRELEQASRFPPIVGQDRFYETLGALYTSDANADGALAAYRRRLLANPNVSDAHRILGQIYLEQSRAVEASAEFTAALLLDRGNAEAAAGRAQVHLRLGEYAEAAKWARQALSLRPQHAAAQYALGTSLLRLEHTDEGTRLLEEFKRAQAANQAAAAREWQVRLLEQAAQARLDAGELGAAAVLFGQIVALRPDRAVNYINQGLVLQSAGQHAAAIDAYRRALALDADANVHGRLATAYAALGRLEESTAERALDDRARASRIRARMAAR